MKNKKFCITFAGAVGSSKSPISNYLSTKLSLPVFNHDAIRKEVKEDLGFLDEKEYLKRRNARIEEVFKNKKSFILDASVDREWNFFKEKLSLHEYSFFIISLDLSKELLTQLYKSKKYTDTLKSIDKYIQDHNNFLSKYSKDVGVHITDKDFLNRLDIAYTKVKEILR